MVYRLHSLGRRVGAEACNIMEEQCNRWRSGGGGGHEFFLTVLRALIGGREKREERKEG